MYVRQTLCFNWRSWGQAAARPRANDLFLDSFLWITRKYASSELVRWQPGLKMSRKVILSMSGSAAGGDIRLCKTKFSVTIARFYCCGSFYHNSENGDNRSENEIQTLCSLGPTNVKSCPFGRNKGTTDWAHTGRLQTSLVKDQDGEEERSHPEQ